MESVVWFFRKADAIIANAQAEQTRFHTFFPVLDMRISEVGEHLFLRHPGRRRQTMPSIWRRACFSCLSLSGSSSFFSGAFAMAREIRIEHGFEQAHHGGNLCASRSINS